MFYHSTLDFKMSYLNIDSIKAQTFDAIVIGSGISGGWAAKELTGKGLRTLVLERGREVSHVTDYPTTMKQPWEFEHRNQITKAVRDANPVVSKCYAFYEGTEQFFVKDAETYLHYPNLLPPKYRERVERFGQERTVCDYIAGMTDRFALDEYKRLFEPYERV